MTLPQVITRLQSEMSAAVHEHWKAFLFEGILLVILGLAAMIVPPLASLAVTIFLGWLFLISGIAEPHSPPRSIAKPTVSAIGNGAVSQRITPIQR